MCDLSLLASMKTWYEKHPEQSRLPDPENFREIHDKELIRMADPYKTVKSEIEAMRVIEAEIDKDRRQALTRPVPVPNRTGHSFEKWRQQEEIKSAMNKAQTCLSMRVSQRQTAQRSKPPQRQKQNV